MATYPGGLPTFTRPTSGAPFRDGSPTDAKVIVGRLSDELEAVCAELGVDPSGPAATAAARFQSLDRRTRWFSAEEYGADLSGNTDAAAGLQAAVDAAAAVGGGIVYIGPGTCRTKSTITLKTDVRIIGAGRGATTIKAWDASNLPALIQTQGYAGLVGTNTIGGVVHAGLSDLTLDGNKANNPSGGDGLRWYGCLPVMERITVRYFKGSGVVSEYHNSDVREDGVEGIWHSVITHDNDGSGVEWAGPHDSVWYGCMSFGNAAKNFHIKPKAAIHVAMGCHAYSKGTTAQYAWYLEAETHLLGCQGEGASVAQVMVGANDCIIKGGKYFATAGLGYKGILVGDATHSGVTGVMIDTKTFNCDGGAVDFTYAGSAGTLDLNNYQSTAGSVLISPSTVRGSWNMRVRNNGAGTLSTGDAFNFPDAAVFRGGANAVQFVGTSQVGNINVSSGAVEWVNQSRMAWYNGNFATKVLEIFGKDGHVVTGGTATPTSAVKAAAGAGATATVTGNDMAGQVTLTTGTAPTPGAMLDITFANAWAATPKSVIFTAESGAGALLAPYTAGRSSTVFTLGLGAAPAASTTYTFNYQVLG